MYTKKMKYAPRQSIDSATFTGSYQKLGSALPHPGAIVKLVNNSNVLVDISTDGSTDEDVAPANSFWLYDETTNRGEPVEGVFVPKGTQFWVKGASALTNAGLIYLVVQYIVEV